MGRAVTFTIKGDADHAIRALERIERQLDTIAQHQAFARLNRSLTESSAVIRRMDRQFRGLNQAFRQLSAQATNFRTSFRGLTQGGVRVNQTLRNTVNLNTRVTNTIRQASQRQQQHTQAVRRTNIAYQTLIGTMKRVQNIARGVNQATAAFRGASTQIAGGIQSGAISTRMSGIALGNQLAQVAAAPLAGNILSPVLEILRQTLVQGSGILTIAAEAGVRIVTGIAGAITKGIGPVVGGAIQVGLTAIGAIFSGGGGFGSTIFSTLALLGQAVQNTFIGITNIAGEMVTQLGNVFVGISEAIRGAFQAAVNIAGQILNQLVTVAEQVVGQVGAVLGKIGKAVLGTAGAITGLSIREIVKTEGSLTEALILLDPKVTPAQKQAIREWAFNARREFANLPANSAGNVLEMFVSTGFQARPEQASEFATAALRLQSATGEQNGQEIARAMAKGYNLFQDEIDAAAARLGTNPADLLADAFFNLRNYSDLTMGEIANRFAEVLGIGKQFKLTFEEIAATTAGVSLALGPEQTFTGVQQLFESFRKLRDDGAAILNREGIVFKDLTDNEKERLAVLTKQRDELSKQAGQADEIKEKLKDLQVARQAARAGDRDDLADRIGDQIIRLRAQLRTVEKTGASEELKAIDEEIERIGSRGGFLTNVLSTLDQIEAKVRSGEISQFEARDIIPNIRALRAAAARSALSPELRQEVTEGTRFEAALGSTSRAQETRGEELAFKFQSIFKEITQPVIAFFNENREAILGFFDSVIAKLREFNAAWQEIISAPEATTFFEDLGARLGLDNVQIDFSNIDPSSFWEGMTSIVDWIEGAGQKVITFFRTVYDLVMQVAAGSEALSAVWETLKGIGGGAGEIIGGLAEGDTRPLENLFKQVEILWSDIKSGALQIVEDLARVLEGILSKVSGFFDRVSNVTGNLPGFGEVAAGFGAYALLRGGLANRGGAPVGARGLPVATPLTATQVAAAQALAGQQGGRAGSVLNPITGTRSTVAPTAGRGAAFTRAASGYGAAYGQAGRFAGRAVGGLARGVAPLAGGLGVYDHLTTAPEEVTVGGALSRAAGIGAAGFAIGGLPGALIGAGGSLIADSIKALIGALDRNTAAQAVAEQKATSVYELTGGLGGVEQVPFLRDAIANSGAGDLQAGIEQIAGRVQALPATAYLGPQGQVVDVSGLDGFEREIGLLIAQMQKIAVSGDPLAQERLAMLNAAKTLTEGMQAEAIKRKEHEESIRREIEARNRAIAAFEQGVGSGALAGSPGFAYGSGQERAAQEAAGLTDRIRSEGRLPTPEETRRLESLNRQVAREPTPAQTRRALEEQSRAAVFAATGEFPEPTERGPGGVQNYVNRTFRDRQIDFAEQREQRGLVRTEDGVLRGGLESTPYDPEGRFYANQGTPAVERTNIPGDLFTPPPPQPVLDSLAKGPPEEESSLPFGLTAETWKSLNRTQREQLLLLQSGQTQRVTSRQGLLGSQSITGDFTPFPKLALDAFSQQSNLSQVGFTRGGLGTRLGGRDGDDDAPTFGAFGLVSGRALRDANRTGFAGFGKAYGDAQQRRIFGTDGGRPGGDEAPYGFVSGVDEYDKYLEGYYKKRDAESDVFAPPKPPGADLATEGQGPDKDQPIVDALNNVAEKIGSDDAAEKVKAAAEKLQSDVDAAATKAKEAADAAAENVQGAGDSLKQGMDGVTNAVVGMGESTVQQFNSMKEQISSLQAEVESLKAQIANSGG